MFKEKCRLKSTTITTTRQKIMVKYYQISVQFFKGSQQQAAPKRDFDLIMKFIV
jgi:hypothetical protein